MEVSSTEYNTLAFHYETFGFYVSIDIRKDAKQFFPQWNHSIIISQISKKEVGGFKEDLIIFSKNFHQSPCSGKYLTFYSFTFYSIFHQWICLYCWYNFPMDGNLLPRNREHCKVNLLLQLTNYRNIYRLR